ncbi:ADP-ribosylglycohydrolase family protein [Capilliphycus salinus ALCB114379]|uniref:ADP-ribosylglycohydrolase family protein n=1 Tax=Capilliphycus salinus TaxID=2768948 RepID=UPI0039A6BF76
MRYSLLSRFEGTLAGVSLASQLTRCEDRSMCKSVSSPPERHQKSEILVNLKKHRWWRSSSERQEEKFAATDEQSLVAQMTRSLIRCQGLNRVDWDRSAQEWQDQKQQRIKASRTQTVNPGRLAAGFSGEIYPLSAGEVALAMLPIALYFHEQPEELQQQLTEAIKVWQHSAPAVVLEEAVQTFSLAIALALKEDLDPESLIPHLLDRLNHRPSDWCKQLQQVQRLAQQKASLETAREELLKNASQADHGVEETSAIAVAFYSFVRTPHDPAIAILRTVELSGASPRATALTGALSGAYNSLSSFPVSWQMQVKTTASSGSGITTEAAGTTGELLQQANELFAVWSGVYNTANRLFQNLHPTLAVSAANGMNQP